MKHLLPAVAAVCMCLLTTACTKGPSGTNGFKINRGVNLSHWLSQSQKTGEERESLITEADMARIRDLGFDHVRIPIDEVQFWDENGNKLPEAWTLLTNALDWCHKHRLRAIVDLHIIRSHNFNAGFNGTHNTLFEDPAAQDALINLWYQLSDVLKGYPNSEVAYEFLNEPVAEEHEQWNQLIAKVHKAIREREPRRTLIIGSNMWQSVGTMKYLKVPEGDRNIILSFHFYEPMALTHYTAPWTEIGQYNGPVNYPGIMIPEEEFAKLDKHQQDILHPFTEEWNFQRLKELVGEAAAVAKELGLPLYCGEWGAFFKAPHRAALKWYTDMIVIFHEYGIPWTTWCYFDEFGFWSPEKQEITDKGKLEYLMADVHVYIMK